MADVYKAKAVVSTVLITKLQYWQQLPWVFAGLAAASEEKTREIGARILVMWNTEPRRQARHRLTWKLLKPASKFILQLQAFVNGLARMECGVAFLEEVATCMLWPTAETTVEEKHGRVSTAKRKHYIALVRVSLSNRFFA